MKHVINTILITFFCFGLFAQTQSAKLKKEQKKLEKKIYNTKNLLKKVSSSRETSYNELKLIENQIDSREALLRVYDNQVKMADVYIKERKEKVDALRIRMEKLKAQYKEMVLYAYKYSDVSLVSPLREISTAIAAVMGIVLLKEKLSLYKVLGISLIVIGAILITI